MDAAKERWWYEPNKNKWKLRKKLRRRKEAVAARGEAQQRHAPEGILESAEEQSRRSY